MNKKVKIIACVLIVVCVVVAICIGRYLRLKKNEDSKYSFDYIKNTRQASAMAGANAQYCVVSVSFNIFRSSFTR